MITDQLVTFYGPGSNIPVTNAAVLSNPVDLLGEGVGVTPAAAGIIIGSTATLFGVDQGVGVVVPELICSVGTTFAGSGTLTVAFEGAPDNGSGSPGSYQIFDQSPAMTIAQLASGQFFYRRKWPIEFPDGFNPRFVRLRFTPSATFSAGTIAYAVVTMGPPAQFNKYAAKNFVVAG